VTVRPFLAIAANDLRRRARDRSVLLIGFVAPLLIAAIMSSAFHQFPTAPHILVAVSGATTPTGQTFVTTMTSAALSPYVTVQVVDDDQAARRLLDSRAVDAAVLFSSASQAPDGTPTVPVIVSTSSVASAASARVIIAHALSGSSEAIVDASVAGSTHRSATFFGPSIAILFLFLLSGANARAIVEERELGTLRRLATAPIAPQTILFAKLAAAGLLGLTSMLTLWLATTRLLGANWGPAGGVLLVSTAVVLAATAIMGAVAVLVRTDAQAQSLGAVVSFLLAIVGGSFVRVSSLPSTLQALAPFTPNAWAQQAFSDLSVDGLSATVLRAAAVVMFFAAGATAIAATRLHDRFAA
jgi:ABC-2 type transport system permease protein